MFRLRMSFRSPAVPVSGLAFAVLFSLSGFSPAAAARYELTGNEVSVHNLIGEVRIVAGSGSSVEVDVTLSGPDAGELRVETGAIDGRQTLRVVYPGDDFVYEPMGRGSSTQLRVRDDGTFGNGHDRDKGTRRVRIHGRGNGLEAHADLVISVPGGRNLNVNLAVGRMSASDVGANLRLDTASAPVSADGIRGALSIDVGSGNVDVSRVDGSLDVDTGSGAVRLRDIRSDRFSVDTGSGEVTGVGITAKDVDIDTGSGEINLASMNAPVVNLDTGSGSVHVELTGDVENLSIDTGSGGVDISVPENAGAELRIETGSGGIDIDVPHESYRTRRSSFHGKIGDGEGQIVVETGSGGVRVLGARRR
jgi:lia operon protein LiaG